MCRVCPFAVLSPLPPRTPCRPRQNTKVLGPLLDSGPSGRCVRFLRCACDGEGKECESAFFLAAVVVGAGAGGRQPRADLSIASPLSPRVRAGVRRVCAASRGSSLKTHPLGARHGFLFLPFFCRRKVWRECPANLPHTVFLFRPPRESVREGVRLEFW